MSKAKCIMVQGTMSNAGKACWWPGSAAFLRRTVTAWLPFKSQNMALNSFVTRDGLEMGRAQVVQAQAAASSRMCG